MFVGPSESAVLQLEDPDCEEGSDPPCESIFSLNAEKILNQAKLFVEQRRFPFAVENHNTNEELAIGYVLIGNGLYDEAIKHFSLLLQGDPELVSAIYGRGIAYGKKSLQEAIEVFKEALKLKSDFRDAYKSLGQAYRELGDFENAMESFQKALLLDQNHIHSLQLRGMMLYHHGSLQEAIGNFKRCLQLEPYNEVCQYMKGLSHVAMGQFYEGIKDQTKVMLNDPLLGQKASSEYLKVKYLREYSRYLHSHLDVPVAEYNVDQDLPGNFKNHWAKNLPFLIEDYEEQPGLQPHIKDVLPQNFDSYSAEVQKLICTADRLGALMQYDTLGFLPNLRIHRGQITYKLMHIQYMIQYNNCFHCFFFLLFHRGQIINIRYLEYFSSILSFVKERLLVYHGAYNLRGLQEVKQALENVNKVEDLLPIMKQFNSKTRDGFTVNSKVPSMKDPGKEYDGFTITITITGDRVGNMLFSVETQTTDERTQQYQSEIEALYKDLTAKGKTLMLSTELGDADAVCNLILSLVYYFCNLMPLSRGSSVVAYSVVMGALMASGKEVLGRIPSGKLFDFEAMTTASPDRFSKTVKSWMNLKSLPSWYQNLTSVSETFQLTRTMIEVLNTDSSSHCPKKS
uniref:Tetratricopeptide repeat domain 13 n=1 Tax=Cyprinus carpio TaxID=7962 RepID=A0A8C2I7G6_CYPCA